MLIIFAYMYLKRNCITTYVSFEESNIHTYMYLQITSGAESAESLILRNTPTTFQHLHPQVVVSKINWLSYSAPIEVGGRWVWWWWWWWGQREFSNGFERDAKRRPEMSFRRYRMVVDEKKCAIYVAAMSTLTSLKTSTSCDFMTLIPYFCKCKSILIFIFVKSSMNLC